MSGLGEGEREAMREVWGRFGEYFIDLDRRYDVW